LPTGRLANLVNADYFVRNVEQVLHKKTTNALPDILEVSDGGANLAVDDSVECYEFRVSPPYVDPAVVREFGQVVERLRADRVDVRILLMPYHPSMWN